MRLFWLIVGIAGFAVISIAFSHDLQTRKMGSLFSAFTQVPVINQVATDLKDPPSYIKATWIGPFPEKFKPQITSFYTDLKPLIVQGQQPDQVFDVAREVALTTTLWRLTAEDKKAGIIEGVATTKMLKFKDDFVIRIRPFSNGAIVDMRSKSRIGRGDFGANAKRITTYLNTLESKLGQTAPGTSS